METPDPATLREQLDQKAASVNRPPEARQAIDTAFAEIERNGEALGLPIGETGPDFSLPDARGRQVRLADRLAQGPVALVFYRGQWCPYCNLELRAYQHHLAGFRAVDTRVIAISPQAPDDALSMREDNDLEFDVLSDLDQRVLDAYRVRFRFPDSAKPFLLDATARALAKQQPDGDWSLPVPATFVLDRAGLIRARHVTMDYRTRMEPTEALRVATELSDEHEGNGR